MYAYSCCHLSTEYWLQRIEKEILTFSSNIDVFLEWCNSIEKILKKCSEWKAVWREKIMWATKNCQNRMVLITNGNGVNLHVIETHIAWMKGKNVMPKIINYELFSLTLFSSLVHPSLLIARSLADSRCAVVLPYTNPVQTHKYIKFAIVNLLGAFCASNKLGINFAKRNFIMAKDPEGFSPTEFAKHLLNFR